MSTTENTSSSNTESSSTPTSSPDSSTSSAPSGQELTEGTPRSALFVETVTSPDSESDDDPVPEVSHGMTNRTRSGSESTEDSGGPTPTAGTLSRNRVMEAEPAQDDDASTDTTMITAVGQQQGIRQFSDNLCRVRLSNRVQGRVLLCGNPRAECTRRFHQTLQHDPSRVGQPGFYMTTYNASSTILDGLEDSFESPEDRDARRERNREALRQQGTTPEGASNEGRVDGSLLRVGLEATGNQPVNTGIDPPLAGVNPATAAGLVQDPLTGEYITRQEQMRRWGTALGTGGVNPSSRAPEGRGSNVHTLQQPGQPQHADRQDQRQPNLPNVPAGPTPMNPQTLDATFLTALGEQVANLSRQMADATNVYQRMAKELQQLQQERGSIGPRAPPQRHDEIIGPANPVDPGNLNANRFYYAVFKGRRTGVYEDGKWAKRLAEGRPGAQTKRFRVENEAHQWIRNKEAAAALEAEDSSIGSRTYTEPQEAVPLRVDRDYGGVERNRDPYPNDMERQREYNEALPLDQVVTADAAERDESAGEAFKIYGTSIQVESEVLKVLCPKGVAPTVRRELMETAVDVSSLPGKSSLIASSQTYADNSIALDQFAEAIGGLADMNARRMNSVPKDSHWRLLGQNALERIKTGEDLRDVTDELGSYRVHAMANMDGQVREILFHAGWTTRNIEIYCTSGLLFRIVRKSLDAYYELHLHLLHLWMEHPEHWEDSGKIHLKYHAQQLSQIRRFAQNRTQLILRTYTYLRDASDKGFHDTKVLVKVTERLQAVAFAQPPARVNPTKQWTCSHCHDHDEELHQGGARSCPAKALTSRKARSVAKEAAKLVREGEADAFTRLIQEAT